MSRKFSRTSGTTLKVTPCGLSCWHCPPSPFAGPFALGLPSVAVAAPPEPHLMANLLNVRVTQPDHISAWDVSPARLRVREPLGKSSGVSGEDDSPIESGAGIESPTKPASFSLHIESQQSVGSACGSGGLQGRG
jgi:hypothetical protein